MSTAPAINMTPDEAVARIQALRQIQSETGCITRRAQSYLLSSLPDTVLTEVAFRLNHPALFGDKY